MSEDGELTQHVEEEPVSDVTLLNDGVDHFSPDQPEPDIEEVRAHLGADDDDDSVDDDQEAENGEGDEPEPEEYVDLLVDDVEGQKTEGVVFLHLARRSKFVKSTFGHSEKTQKIARTFQVSTLCCLTQIQRLTIYDFTKRLRIKIIWAP